MAAREVIHFPFWAQPSTRLRFPALLPPERPCVRRAHLATTTPSVGLDICRIRALREPNSAPKEGEVSNNDADCL
jgi:hypothetical protein